MLLVLLPLAFVLCTIQMAVNALSVRLVVLPKAIIDISIRMDQPTLSISFVVHPVALVHGSVRPNLHTLALSGLGSNQPFALVSRAVFKNHCRPLFAFAKLALKSTVIVNKITELGTHFLNGQRAVRLTCTFTFS